MFVLLSGNLNRLELQQVFARAAKRMDAMARTQKPPFVARIYKGGRVQLWKSARDLATARKKRG